MKLKRQWEQKHLELAQGQQVLGKLPSLPQLCQCISLPSSNLALLLLVASWPISDLKLSSVPRFDPHTTNKWRHACGYQIHFSFYLWWIQPLFHVRSLEVIGLGTNTMCYLTMSHKPFECLKSVERFMQPRQDWKPICPEMQLQCYVQASTATTDDMFTSFHQFYFTHYSFQHTNGTKEALVNCLWQDLVNKIWASI